MKTKHRLVPLAACCAVAAVLAGCATEDPQASGSSLDENNREYGQALSPTGLSQPLILDERISESGNFVTNGAINLHEWRHFDTNAAAKADLSAVQFDVTELQAQAPTNSKLRFIFDDSDRTNNNDGFFWEEPELRPQGLRFLSFRF